MSRLAVKTLSDVEVNSWASNQHEFHGVTLLKQVFGTKRLEGLPARFVYMSNSGVEREMTGSLTWYDARANHPTRTEYRLYYNSILPSQKAKAGDTLLITFDGSGWVNVFIIAKGTQLANFLVNQLGRIGEDCCIVTDSRNVNAIESVLPPV